MLNLLPENVRPYVLRALAFVKGLSRPVKVFTITTLVAAIALASYVSVKSANPSYAVLYANLDREDAAAVVAKLKEMKVPYRLEGEGTVEVPEAQARELRLELAGGGLPRGGSVGFESFDKMRLGATEFEQRILYRRALEGELARTIGSLAAVQSARVHLVLPEKSVFVSRNEPASASVVVKLRAGRTLGGGEIGSIVHLVSSSVAGLTPDRVALVSTEGTVLHKPRRPGDESGGSDDERASQTRSLEATLEERARAMVEKVVGAGHVDVRVTAELDTARTERVEDRYDPTRSSLRSEERSVERMGEDAAGATGVPGAQSNLPTGDGRMDGGVATPGAIRESHTRNFELDHVVEKRFIASGTLRRVTVAVVVDGVPLTGAPRPREEMDKISSLVRSAVGADEKRGDLVTVESVPFIAPAAEPALAAAPPPFVFQPRRHGPYAAGAAVAVLAGVIAMTISLRRRSRRKAAAAAVAATALAAEKTLLGVSEPTEEDLGALEPTPEELRRQVNDLVSRDPATAALILRQWLGQPEEARQEAA
ncbi:MAG TPA: flagellar basal-body MS-ring/collar protein FliF [Labilithrix sp.]|nr:flagellar basal-body MS-ring/collar protein FliF [Labilithrix sp.]